MREFGKDMHTLLYLKRRTSKDPLQSAGDSAQRSVTAWTGGGGSGGEAGGRTDTRTRMAESLYRSPET